MLISALLDFENYSTVIQIITFYLVDKSIPH